MQQSDSHYILYNQTKTLMRKKIFLTILMGMIFTQSFTQNKIGDKIYSVGLGIGNENNVSNYGLYVSNDLKFYLKNKLSVNPRISLFQSLGSIEPEELYGYRSHYGFFFDLGANISLIKNDSYDLSLNVGPSYQLGKETYSIGRTIINDVVVEENFKTNSLRRLGLYCDLEFSYQVFRQIHSIGIRSNYFDIYPEFLGITYKIGLKL